MSAESAEIGRRLKEVREMIGLTQNEVAKKLGLTDRSTLANWETGRINIDAEMLGKLAEFYGITPNYFLVKGIELQEANYKTTVMEGWDEKVKELRDHVKKIETIVNELTQNRTENDGKK